MRGQKRRLSDELIKALEATVIGSGGVRLSRSDLTQVREYNWQQYAPPDMLRQRVNVGKRRQDLPRPRRVMPTLLGNVLRKHEDDTGWGTVESKVQELFDEMPFSLQLEHDEQRTRLDLYCSVVFVTATVALLAVIRFAPEYPRYAAGTAVLGLIMIWLMYRAAIASARAYGRLLVTIAKWDRECRVGAPRHAAIEGSTNGPAREGAAATQE